jgi:hypothetical protein
VRAKRCVRCLEDFAVDVNIADDELRRSVERQYHLCHACHAERFARVLAEAREAFADEPDLDEDAP